MRDVWTDKDPHHFKSASKTQCTQCFEAWIPSGISYQGEDLKTVHGHAPVRLLGIHHNMWLDAKSQRRKVIDGTIEVAAYLYKNDNLRIDQRLKVISMCLPSLFSFSAPLIDWPESDLKTLTAIWVRAYKNAWNLGKSTATCLFTFPREKGGLQVKLPLGTLFTSVWGNLERCSQLDDGTRQMLAISHREALHEHGCLNLLELQDATQYISWKQASKNEVTFACYLVNKLDIRVEWDPFNPDLIASSPDATLAALAPSTYTDRRGDDIGGVLRRRVGGGNQDSDGRHAVLHLDRWAGQEPRTALPTRVYLTQLWPSSLAP